MGTKYGAASQPKTSYRRALFSSEASRSLALTTTLITFALAAAGCEIPGMGKQESATDPTVRPMAAVLAGDNQAKGAQAFRTTVYPLVRRDCTKCHESIKPPLFAASDVMTAFNAALPRANFKKPAESPLVLRSKDGHCGEAICKNDGVAMTDAVALWKAKWDDPSKYPEADLGLNFKIYSQALAENSGDKLYLEIVNGHYEQELSVDIELTGTAEDDEDYQVSVPLTVKIPPFQTSTTVELSMVDDLTYESDETIVATLRNPVGAPLGDKTIQVITILEDDAAPKLRWNLLTQSVTETAATIQVQAILNGPSALPVSAKVIAAGTASSGSDYALASQTVTIAPGQTSANFAVQILGDSVDEIDEELQLTLSEATGAVLDDGVSPTHVLTIQDNDAAPTLQFASASQTVTESVALPTVTVNVNLSAVSGKTVSVPFTLSGTASSADHELVAGTIVIDPLASQGSVSFKLKDDALFENSETLVLALGTANNATASGQLTHTVTINDNDAAPTLAVSSATQTVSESGTATVTATLNKATAFALSVPYVVTGTATGGGTDHDLANGSILISAGATSGSVSFNITPDTIDENDETVIVTLQTTTNATLGSPIAQTITITDNDAAPTVAWSSASQIVSETAGTITLTAQLSAASGKSIQIPFGVSGTATAGTYSAGACTTGDYCNLPTSPMTIAAGQTSYSVTFNVRNDGSTEADETVVFAMNGSPTNTTYGSPATHTVTITDQAVPITAQLTSASATVSESGSPITATVQLNAAPTSTLTVPFTVTGTATGGGTDYTISASPVSFAAGETTKTITITPIVADTLDEPDETVIITLGAPSSGSLGATTSETITITDDDAPSVVKFSAATQTVSESGTVTITATLDKASSYAISVPYSLDTTNSTATAGGTDHNLANGSISIAAGATSGTTSFTVTTDTLDEPNETVIVSLGTVAQVGGVTVGTLGSPSTQTITITDDDAASVVRFAAATQSVGESGLVTITAALDKASGYAISVPYSVDTPNSTATGGGTDYTLANGTFTFAAGATTATAMLTVATDAIDENNETVIVNLGSPTNATQGTPATHTVTITDDDNAPTISWSTASQSVNENPNSTVTLTAVLSQASAKAISATVTIGATSTATAGMGNDFNIPNATISIPAGSTSGTVDINLTDDTLDESNETVVLTLASPTNASVGATPTHTITIADNDPLPTVTWELASQTVSEAGALGVKAKLSTASGRDVSVTYAVGTGTATAGTYSAGSCTSGDYCNLTTGSITVTAGQTLSAAMSIPLRNDTTSEPSDETIAINLGTSTTASVGTPSTHTVTITDDDIMSDPKIEAFRNSVYVITRRDCVSCHALLKNPTHASDDIALAYAVAKPKANFTSPGNSIIVTQTTNNHDGCGVKCQTNGSEMTAAVAAWAAAENSGGGGSGTVLVTSDTILRSANRYYVKSLLDEVFGPTASVSPPTGYSAGTPAITTAKILNQRGVFGGPCDHYANPLVMTQAPMGNCTAYGDSQIPIIPGSVSGKYAYLLRACDQILNQDAAVKYAGAQVLGVGSIANFTAWPSSSNASAGGQNDFQVAYSLFYPGKTASTQALDAIKSVATAAQTAGYPIIDGWRYMLLSLCRSPDWQVP